MRGRIYSREEIAQARRLRRAGWSCRAVAEETGMSKSVVHRRFPGRRQRLIYCRPCGAWVEPPCLACRVRGVEGKE